MIPPDDETGSALGQKRGKTLLAKYQKHSFKEGEKHQGMMRERVSD